MWEGAEKCLLRDLDRSEETCLLSFIFGGNETSLQELRFGQIKCNVSFEVQHGYSGSKSFTENSWGPFSSQFKPRGISPWALVKSQAYRGPLEGRDVSQRDI